MDDYQGSAQERADKAYRERVQADEEKRASRNYKSYFRSAKAFIRNDAVNDDLGAIQNLIDEKRKQYMAGTQHEIYVFSGSPTFPLKQLTVSEAVSLNDLLLPGTEIPVKQFSNFYLENRLEELKQLCQPDDYQFVYVYKFTGQSPENADHDRAVYRLDHKEFNLFGQRKPC